MNDYIERLGLLAALAEIDYPFSTFDDAFLAVQEAPAADVVPIIHSRWIFDENAVDWGIGGYVCGACGIRNNNLPLSKKWSPYNFSGSKYCPNCGAKMDLEEHNNEN